MAHTRLARLEDAAEIAARLVENRSFLAPWEPVRPEEYFTAQGQYRLLDQQLTGYIDGHEVPLVVTDDTDRIVGRITVNGIVRGALQSAAIGYWIASSHNGRGLATAAVGEVKSLAFGPLGLHRLQAETVPHNGASQRVLRRNGFQPFGLAPEYLRIDGRWQDHVLFQALNPRG
ncbi:GNAT family N-acetyltransferase [Nocardiopsis salina]|uniref:GNAT family N-acetyltransferase n=1 Tax=Nocardiopsis salina TaxID=245836 RepID=UPI000347C226|nr:GNAT family protein [Nocardiopsis salina]